MPRQSSDTGRRRHGGGGTGLVVDRIAGMDAEAWIPDTPSFATLGRRSGMTKVGVARQRRWSRPPASDPREGVDLPGRAGRAGLPRAVDPPRPSCRTGPAGSPLRLAALGTSPPLRGVGGWASALAAGCPPPHEVGAEVASRSDDGGGGATLEDTAPTVTTGAAEGRRCGTTKVAGRRAEDTASARVADAPLPAPYAASKSSTRRSDSGRVWQARVKPASISQGSSEKLTAISDRPSTTRQRQVQHMPPAQE